MHENIVHKIKYINRQQRRQRITDGSGSWDQFTVDVRTEEVEVAHPKSRRNRDDSVDFTL